MSHASPAFLSGVIEGFYGKPWTLDERRELFDWMARWRLDTYFYAPKDDLHHRALWREPYGAADAADLARLVGECRRRGIRFIYALSPGLDIRYSEPAELGRICARFEQVAAMGCRDFSLLFDDIPDRLDPPDAERWHSFALAQCHVANAAFAWTREHIPDGRFVFCPTAYCGRMVAGGLGGHEYLSIVGRELAAGIDVFWTGPDIVSREITVEHARELTGVLRRKPLIWDNVHANDYDGRRFFCGPYSGRPPELRAHVAGLLSNPNNELPLNYVPLRTLADFVHAKDDWNPRASYLAAMREWLPEFATVGRPIELDDLTFFGDCFYLPYEEGPRAEALYHRAQALMEEHSNTWRDDAAAFRAEADRLRDVCTRVTEVVKRPLFHALSRRIWDLREQLDLVDRFAAFRSSAESGGDGSPPRAFQVRPPRGIAARLHDLARRAASRGGRQP